APAASLPEVVPAVLPEVLPAAVVSLSDLVLEDCWGLRCFLSLLALLFFAGFGVSLDDWPLAALPPLVPALAPALAPVPDSDLMPVSALVRLSGAWVLLDWAAAS